MSIIPKITCPPDYSIRCFRLIDSMSFGIVKGVQTEVSIPTKGICIPVNRFDDKRLVLTSKSTKKISIDGIAEYGDLKEEYQFNVNTSLLKPETKHKYELYDDKMNLISSINFSVNKDFSVSLQNAVSQNAAINSLVTFDALDATNGIFYVQSIKAGIKYRHLFYFDLDGFGGSEPFPFIHPGNLIQKYRKYENGGVKIILIIPEFNKVDLKSCGCTDSSGYILSNKKYFQYSSASEYEKIQDPKTPILISSTNTDYSYTWKSNIDHIGYHLSSGDLIRIEENPSNRVSIENIQGFDILTDNYLGNNTINDKNVLHVWSPNKVNWKNAGEMTLFTGGQDVNENDSLLIETLYLKNPHDFDIPMRILIGV